MPDKKSGIQMIEEIAENISILDRRFTIVEQMMKELLNRENTNKPNKITMSTPVLEKKAIPKIGDPPTKKVPTAKTKVMGTIKNKEGRVVTGVNIIIYDENNNVIKETRSNRAGQWLSFLPSGRYIAEYKLEGMINANVKFNVQEGQELIRVASPEGF